MFAAGGSQSEPASTGAPPTPEPAVDVDVVDVSDSEGNARAEEVSSDAVLSEPEPRAFSMFPCLEKSTDECT